MTDPDITPADLRAAADRFRSRGFQSMSAGQETTALLYLTMARECEREADRTVYGELVCRMLFTGADETGLQSHSSGVHTESSVFREAAS